MKLNLYQVDAFTNKIFGGNSACVVPLEKWLPDELLLKIARENAVAETAFFVLANEGYHLRWFTPEIEMDLCGHATLATAHVLKQHLGFAGNQIILQSKSGELKVALDNELYTMDFPSRMPVPAELPVIIKNALSIQPTETWLSRDYMLVYEKEQDVRDIQINRQVVDQINLDPGGIIITAKGEQSDFVSRFFATQASIFEDPVTGSSHCTLIPYWSRRLNKTKMSALQLSERGGQLFCDDKGDRVLIAGESRTYSVGMMRTE